VKLMILKFRAEAMVLSVKFVVGVQKSGEAMGRISVSVAVDIPAYG
jgi:hypothetical protein